MKPKGIKENKEVEETKETKEMVETTETDELTEAKEERKILVIELIAFGVMIALGLLIAFLFFRSKRKDWDTAPPLVSQETVIYEPDHFDEEEIYEEYEVPLGVVEFTMKYDLEDLTSHSFSYDAGNDEVYYINFKDDGTCLISVGIQEVRGTWKCGLQEDDPLNPYFIMTSSLLDLEGYMVGEEDGVSLYTDSTQSGGYFLKRIN